MKLKFERPIQLLFSGIFFVFIAITAILFITNKPILYDFPKGKSLLNWYSYLLLIFLATILSFVTIRYFLKSKLISNKYIGNKWMHIVLILMACVIPRIIWISIINVKPMNDFELYHAIASSLSQGKVIANSYIAVFPHVIGYPAVLSVLYRIFGAHVIVAQVFNIVLGCGIAILLYLLGRKLLSVWSGIIAALIWCFWPSQIFYSCLVSSEALFTFMELLGILFAIYLFEQKKGFIFSIIMFSLLGVYISLQNCIRPFGIIFVLALLIYCIFVWKPGYKKLVVKPALIIVFLLSYSIISNITGSVLSDIIGEKAAGFGAGFNVFVGSNIKYGGSWNMEDSNVLQNYMLNTDMSAQEIHSELLKKGFQRFADQKTDNIKLFKEKHITMWVADNDNIQYIMTGLNKDGLSKFSYVKYMRLFNKVSNLYYYVILILCLLVVPVIFNKKHNNNIIFILIIFCGIVAAHMLLEVAGRYHYPVVSMFSLICGYSIVAYTSIKNVKNGI